MSQPLQSLGKRERVHPNPRTLCVTPAKTQTGEEKKADELGTSGHEDDTQRFPQVPGHPGLGAGEAISLDKPTGTHKNSLLSPAGKGQPDKAGNSYTRTTNTAGDATAPPGQPGPRETETSTQPGWSRCPRLLLGDRWGGQRKPTGES